MKRVMEHSALFGSNKSCMRSCSEYGFGILGDVNLLSWTAWTVSGARTSAFAAS